MNKFFICAVAALLFSGAAWADNPVLAGSKDRREFNDGWKFKRYGLQADGTRIEEPAQPETPTEAVGWRSVAIPHDFAIEGPFRMDLAGNTGRLPYKGIGRYSKNFFVAKDKAGKKIYVDFDGVMANAEVYVNGQRAGGWPYGYASFRTDITPFVKFGAENRIDVRTDTEHWDSRWYPGAGIYRNVWITESAPLHVDYNGINITATDFSSDMKRATVNVDVTLRNTTADRRKATVDVAVYELDSLDHIGRRVYNLGARTVEMGGDTVTDLKISKPISDFRLWNPGAPARYMAEVTVKSGRDRDVYFQPFGIRKIEVSREGFFINGKRTEIKGVCQHHDLGALGAALNVSALRRQLEMLRDMGCNAIRTSHNPPAPELLDLADKMGLIVQDEAFDAWRNGKRKWDYNKLFERWHKADLEAFAKRDRNHPSVVMWSIGNEVMEQRDSALTAHLAGIVRSLDTTRPVTEGYNDPDGGRDAGAAQALDIMGVNYFFGQQGRWDADPRYAAMPTHGSETSSCLSTRGFYLPDGEAHRDFQISSYDFYSPGWGCTPDTQFRTNAQYPHLLGEFVWTGFDYLGEPTPFNSDDTNLLNFRNDPEKKAELEAELRRLEESQPPSRSSYFGIIDLAGFPKDRYYIYQSHWRPELPMAHILPHWNWPGREGGNVPVHVYTSGDEAELFVNGHSQGRRAKRPGQDFRLVWDSVAYVPGTVEVVAYREGKEWARDTVRTAGKPAYLQLSSYSDNFGGKEYAFVTIAVKDRDGVTVPDAADPLEVTVSGGARVVATDNGDPTSFEPFQSSRKKAFNGLCLAIIAADGKPGTEYVVTASAPGLQAGHLKLRIR